MPAILVQLRSGSLLDNSILYSLKRSTDGPGVRCNVLLDMPKIDRTGICGRRRKV